MAATNYSIDTPWPSPSWSPSTASWAPGTCGRWPSAGIATTFFFSRLWRRAQVVTDAELVKYRYSGKLGNALRIFKGVYFGVIINCFVLGWVFRALIKVMTVLTPLNPW